MPPTIKDLNAVRGDTISKTFTAFDSAGSALNLTGATVWFTVKLAADTLSDDTAAITRCYWVSGGAASGITVSSPSSGVIQVDAPAADTANLNPTLAYVYDVQVKDASSRIYTIIAGAVNVAADTTRRLTTP